MEMKDPRETRLHTAMRTKTDEIIKPYLDEFRMIWGEFSEPTHQSEVKIINYTKTTIGTELREKKEFDIVADEVYILKSSRTKKYIIFECETKSVTSNLQDKIDRYRRAFKYSSDIKLVFVLCEKYDIRKLQQIPRWVDFTFIDSNMFQEVQ